MNTIPEKDKKLSWRLVASIVCFLLALFFFHFRNTEPMISAIGFALNIGLGVKNLVAHLDIVRKRKMHRDSPH